MIDDLRRLAVFAAVADAGSFSAAARRLKLSTSVVSHHVSTLEARLRTSLLFRSTRSLSLTPEGHKILDAARRMVAAGEEAIDALSEGGDTLVGTLRLTMPSFGARIAAIQAVWAFARAHPAVVISLSGTDRPVDLVKDGYDLAIRLGELADSSLKSRRIGSFQRALVAAPGYLETRGDVTSLEDLRACDFVSYAMLPRDVALVRGREQITFVPQRQRLEVDSIASGKSAVLAGLGVLNLPLSEVSDELQRGDLVEVLPDWRLPDLGVYVVWPDIGPQKNLARRLIEFLAERTRG